MKIAERFTASIDSIPEEELRALTTDLTPAERLSPYARYYDLGPAPLDPHQAATLQPGHPLDPTLAFLPEQLPEKMLAPALDPWLSGYCVLPDGTAFGAAWADLSTVTQEMEDWFDEHWAPEGDLFYKVWYPGAHVRHFSDGAVESVGREPEILRLGRAPALPLLGFPEDIQAVDPDFLTLRGGCTKVMKLHDRAGREALDVTLLHFYRRSGRGKFICTRFWMGLRLDLATGKPVRTLPWYASVPEEAARLLALHCATEYATNARNMALFWAEQHPSTANSCKSLKEGSDL